MRKAATVFCVVLLGLPVGVEAVSVLSRGGPSAAHRGVWQVDLSMAGEVANPFFEVELKVAFTRPDGTCAVVDGFFMGGTKWAARAYCDQTGRWSWRTESNRASLNGKSGTFEVITSKLPGKLRRHRDDPRQFAYDDGEWFLHVGDTGYRYVTDTEPLWRQYIDEAAEVGFTKVRTWFCRGRGDVRALFAKDRSGLDLAYWNEIERRLLYALENYPRIQFQLIPYGEDTAELKRYAKGDRASVLVARYAQARFSALPNIHWCISNDRDISAKPGKRSIAPQTIERIGRDMRAREPWGTLLTNHQRRFQGYSFVDADWSDIVTLEDRDQVAGELVLKYRAKSRDPVVLDEDRYGIYISPKHDRYFFRRLMWANLFSGGQATYGGLATYEAFAGSTRTKGVQGYLTAVEDGRLDDGARDFKFIRRFFREAQLTLVGLEPNDALAGGDGYRVKVMAGKDVLLAYLQNADGKVPQTANVRETPGACRLDVPAGSWRARWFDPRNGKWHEVPDRTAGGRAQDFRAPSNGDAVLLLRRAEP